jgi:hypothetical protein
MSAPLHRVLHWPPEPYKGLAYYGPDDALLFAGRNDDIDACVLYLAEPQTRMLVLHGRTACGKSSFLRAGLIPALEERGFGYLFLRTTPVDGKDPLGDPVFIRCGADPVSRIAEQTFLYVSAPRTVNTATGPRTLDLSTATLGCRTIEQFVARCQEPDVLLDALAEISKVSLHTLVVILDQAEEVITLTQPLDPGRRRFFQFLQEFNSTQIGVKFVVALRKEHFGDFFSLTQLDASIKTDIKQFPLSDLQPEEVLAAIELPTVKTGTWLAGPPFDSYHFQFAPGIAQGITDDLFAAVPSGGVLPVMQIVCRDLSKEARARAGETIIDGKLYETGNRVAGRIGRHISQALLEAFVSAAPPVQNVADEETRWRKVLYKLVIRDSDGTVKSATVSAELMHRYCKEEAVTTDTEHVLSRLRSGDALVLRSFSHLNIEQIRKEMLYSLGHDAIGLALYDWNVQEGEKTRRMEAERASRARLRWTWVATAAAIAAILAGVFTTDYYRYLKLLGEVRALQAAVTRLSRTDPKLAVTVGVEAMVRIKDFGPVWSMLFPSPRHDITQALTKLLSEFPQPVKSSPDFVTADNTERFGIADPTVFPLIRRAGFYFRGANNAAEIVHVLPEDRARIAFPGTKQDPSLPQSYMVQEAPPDTILARRGSSLLSVIVKRSLVGTYDLAYFLKKAKLQSLARSRNHGLLASGSLVLLFLDDRIASFESTKSNGVLVIQSFEFDATRPAADPFVLRHRVTAPSTSTRGHQFWLVDGVLFQATARMASAETPAAASGDRLGDPAEFTGLTAYDLGTDHKWSVKPDDGSSLASCLHPPEARKPGCRIDVVPGPSSQMQLALIRVRLLAAGSTPQGAKQASEQPKALSKTGQPAGDGDKLVIVDPHTGSMAEADINTLNRLRGRTSSDTSTDSQSGKTPFYTPRQEFAVGGTIEEPILALIDGPVIDVFSVRRKVGPGEAEVPLGTLRAPDRIDSAFVTNDGSMILGISESFNGFWRRGEAFKPHAAADPGELLDIACRNKLVLQLKDKTAWFAATGLTEPPAIDRCGGPSGPQLPASGGGNGTPH